jgi:plasmid rolling circle replication initiator protein Rep
MPTPAPPEKGRGAKPIVAPLTEDSNSAIPLAELSPDRDKPWDIHRGSSDTIASYYRGTEHQRYAERIRDCSELLDFRLVPHPTGKTSLKLSSARFCRVRTCIVCTWRKSLMYRARAFKAIPPLIEDHPKIRFLFITLTAKNCEITELRETITHLNKSFARLTKLKVWPGVGYLKSVEVTRGRDGSAHPHLHVLVGVEPSYFGRNYIKQTEWVALWRQSLRVDYNPMLDVQALKSEDSLVGLLTEVIKYQVKPNDLLFADREWFLEYTKQIHRTQAIAFGGLFREYFRNFDREATDEDLIGEGDDPDDPGVDEGHLYFGWRRIERKYRLVDR